MTYRYLLAFVAILLPQLASAQSAAVRTALAYLDAERLQYGLTEADVDQAAVDRAYASRLSGTSHVHLGQRLNGVTVTNAELLVNVDRSGRVLYAPSTFVPDVASRVSSHVVALQAAAAAAALAAHVGLAPTAPFSVVATEGGPEQAVTLSDGGVALEPVSARLNYYPLEDGSAVRLAWKVTLYEMSAQHHWVGLVDAATGAVLRTFDLVVNDHTGYTAAALAREDALAPVAMRHPSLLDEAAARAPAGGGDGSSYRVYPIPVESPNHASPPPPADARVLVAEPADGLASPFGWHDTNNAAGAEFLTTQGNNAHAYTDTNDDNNPDGGSSPSGGAGLDFDFTINLGGAPNSYRPAAVTNLFFWSNVIHDVMYQYGFDEAGGNFQENNYGRGGTGSDYVFSEAQDGGGTCNANFGTPPDGQNPRMQMYVCGSRDGDLDNAIIAHEYGHGISNRLVGNSTSCLQNNEQMGEGWSDYLGLMLTMEPGDAGSNSRGFGTYLFGEAPTGGGIRESPYSTTFGINNYTYERTKTMGNAPHSIGFVWATILWEVTWEMIAAQGGTIGDVYNENGTAGNQVMMALVTEGMQNTVCSPGFVNARDAIMAADVALYGGAHMNALWAGFARRGLGLNANQGSSNLNTDNEENFTVPVELTAFTGVLDGAAVDLTWTTASETNNAGFEVQVMSPDAADWRGLGFVEGHGTTVEAQRYAFRAEGLAAGTHQFRLRQVDFDGTTAFHDGVEVTVGVPGTHALSAAYPNPFNPTASFTLAVAREQAVRIELLDALGRSVALVHEGRLDAGTTHRFALDGTSLASGLYVVRVTGETFSDARRVTLLK